MKNDRIFILLLVILLPLTGCLDAVGEVDADSEENSGSSTVNNYYNNTTIELDGPIYEYLTFEVAKTNGNGSWERTYARNPEFIVPLLGTFNTSAGNLYAVVSHASSCYYDENRGWINGCNTYLDAVCGNHKFQYMISSASSYSRNSEQLIRGTIGNDCVVYVYLNTPVGQTGTFGIEEAYAEIAFERIPLTEYQE